MGLPNSLSADNVYKITQYVVFQFFNSSVTIIAQHIPQLHDFRMGLRYAFLKIERQQPRYFRLAPLIDSSLCAGELALCAIALKLLQGAENNILLFQIAPSRITGHERSYIPNSFTGIGSTKLLLLQLSRKNDTFNQTP